MSKLSDDPEKRARSLANLRGAPKGAQRNLKHGARAQVEPRRLEARVQSIYDELAEAVPLQEASGGPLAADRMLVRQLAEAMCRLEDVTRWIDANGWTDKRGKPRSALRWEDKLRRTVTNLLDRLGMSPAARARIGVDLAKQVDLADAMSDPNPERRSQKLRDAGVVDSDAEEIE